MTTVVTGIRAENARHALVLARQGILSAELLPGDASDRRFSRIRFPDSSRPSTAILLQGAEAPFVETARLLRSVRIPVPEIYEEDERAGIVIEEDFGDVLLHDEARAACPVAPDTSAALAGTYRGLVDLLVSMQRSLCPDPAGPAPLRRAFDAAAFERELRQFEGWTWKGLLGARPEEAEERDVLARLRALAVTVAALPPRFAHRDFHSRNLMIRPGRRIGVVDFQDARFGPPHYDLASLLFDGYASLDPDFAAELFDRYETAFPTFPDRGQARAAFDLTAVQRVLKALGSFAYLAEAKGKRAFLDFVPKALGDAVILLRSVPELAPLHALLARGSAAFA